MSAGITRLPSGDFIGIILKTPRNFQAQSDLLLEALRVSD